MLLFILVLTVLSSTESTGEKCKGELGECLGPLTMMGGHQGLPVSSEQVNNLCSSYKIGMACVEKWNKECLPANMRRMAERHMASVKLFMGMLCADGDFTREYLSHEACFKGVTGDWDRCNGYFQDAIKDVNSQSQLSVTQHTVDTCCARYGFNRCISLASRAKCTTAGALFLRRVSEILSHDARCEIRFSTAMCSAASARLHGLLALLALVSILAVLMF